MRRIRWALKEFKATFVDCRHGNCRIVMIEESTEDSSDIIFDYLQPYDNAYALQALPAMLYLAILMLVGCVGNSVVCYVYTTKFKRTTSTTYFIVALAVFDLLNCVTGIPYEIIDLRFNYSLGMIADCRIMPFVITYVSISSALILVTVAVYRYRKVCRALRKQASKRAAKVAILMCCLVSAIVSAPSLPLYGARTIIIPGGYVNGSECGNADDVIDSLFPVFYNVFQFFLFFSGVVIIIVLYLLIWRQIGQQKDYVTQLTRTPQIQGTREETAQSTSFTGTSQEDGCAAGAENRQISRAGECGAQGNLVMSQRGARSQKTTKMMFLISLVFILSFLPHLGIMAATAINKSLYDNLQGAQVAAYNICQRSFFINSASNPIIYSFCSVNFRRAVRNMIKRKSDKDRLG
ncbi:orexin receptor type 2-like [Haliotis cracherodii]|uniref:orexin receptor type 2-like n=1 Tax=Haliotis cracherodii TaxID=6455 RepID=UPI0039E852CA